MAVAVGECGVFRSHRPVSTFGQIGFIVCIALCFELLSVDSIFALASGHRSTLLAPAEHKRHERQRHIVMPASILNLPDPAVERELFALVKRERLARDTGDFDFLSQLYWEDSVVRVTWFEGTIAEFIAVSRDAHQRGRGRGIHVINPIRSEVVGHRAIVESQGEIHIRPKMGDVFCDVVAWCRFFSRLEQRDGQWRLQTFDSIYCKDRIDTVDPAATLTLDPSKLENARQSYKHLRYLNLSANFTVPDDLPGDDRPDIVKAFYADATKWLHGQE